MDLEQLVKYNFFAFQNTDLEDLLRKHRDDHLLYINLNETGSRASTPVTACFLGFLNYGEIRYLMYAFIYRGRECAFAAEVGNQEDGWPEFVEQGQCFQVMIDPSEPKHHFIVEKPFSHMNGHVLQLGSCRNAQYV